MREIRLTVSWQDGKQRQEVSASQIVVILPETVGQTQGAPTPAQAQQPGTLGAPVPVPQPTQGMTR